MLLAIATAAPPPEPGLFELIMAPADLWAYVVSIWQSGGWVMIPLALLTVFIYFEATSLLYYLGKAKVKSLKDVTISRWVRHPKEGKGHAGDVIRYVVAQGYSDNAILSRIDEVRAAFIPKVNQKIMVLSVLVTIAPLMGLLGTVIGMLTTFRGLASGGGSTTVDLIARGISEALITTQTGLMIAIPGYLFISAIMKRRNQYQLFLAAIENHAIQHGHGVSESNDKEAA